MTAPTHTTGPDAGASRVCTIRSPRLARAVLVALVTLSLAASLWLAATMVSGPWFADTLVVEGVVAGTVALAGVLLALSLSRALGCGHCHTPQCTCR